MSLLPWRAIARRRGRWVWAPFAGGLTFFTAGSVLFTAVVQHFTPVPYPSISDFSFLADYPLALVGMILLVRETVPNISKTIWVDGLIAALGVGAREAMLVLSPILSTNSGNVGAVIPNVLHIRSATWCS